MAARANKTQMTDASVDAFIAGIEPEARRADAQALAALMARASGEPARMWGGAIIGFGVRRYRYDSGREGEICRVGFSPRKAAFALYLGLEARGNPKVAALGKVGTGKGCVYVKRLTDIDLDRLAALIRDSFAKLEH